VPRIQNNDQAMNLVRGRLKRGVEITYVKYVEDKDQFVVYLRDPSRQNFISAKAGKSRVIVDARTGEMLLYELPNDLPRRI